MSFSYLESVVMNDSSNSQNRIYDGDFKKRSDVHLARKIWHTSGVLLIFIGWIVFPFWLSMTLLGVAWLVFVPADLLRLFNPEMNKKITRWFKPIMRKNEVDKLAGTTYLLTGVVFIGLLFPDSIVGLSLLFLAFADPIASYIGIRYGRDKIFGHKSVQGFMAAFVVCFVLTYGFLFVHKISDYILIVSLLAGLIGALAELIPIAKIDDNFTMPVLSSLGLYFVFNFFNIFQYLK
ncbi:MAG: diacylglycerol/polyprenol kinase family protein [Pseudobdellovibrio sp.]